MKYVHTYRIFNTFILILYRLRIIIIEYRIILYNYCVVLKNGIIINFKL